MTDAEKPRRRYRRGHKRRPSSADTAQQIATAKKTAEALALASEGWGYKEIGEAIGVSKTRAFQIVKAALEKAQSKIQVNAEGVINLELIRLDQMTIGIAKPAMAGDLNAIDRMLKIMTQRASLLGLNAATKINVAGKDGGPIENRIAIDDAAAEVKRKLADAIAKTASRGVPGEPDDRGSGGAQI